MTLDTITEPLLNLMASVPPETLVKLSIGFIAGFAVAWIVRGIIWRIVLTLAAVGAGATGLSNLTGGGAL